VNNTWKQKIQIKQAKKQSKTAPKHKTKPSEDTTQPPLFTTDSAA
jgi:hypothetical protein